MKTSTLPLAAPEDEKPAALITPIAGAKPKSALIQMEERGVKLLTMEDCFLFARAVIDSGMAPRGMDTPQKIFIAVQMGAEIGLTPMAALQNIAVINGRPTVWGDAVGAICGPLIESYKDEMFGTMGDDAWGCRVTIHRKGRAEPIIRAFTIADAKKAGLWGKAGPWTQYPNRMLLMRARTFAYRDACPDALRGVLTAEEAQELPEKNVTPPRLDDLDAPKTEAET
jgi:hypothetical protein